MFSASKTTGPSGYNLTNSLRFRQSASAYLSRTFGSGGNRKTWTWSAWVKRGALGGNQSLFSARPQSGAGFTFLRFVSDTNPDTITFADNNGASLVTSALHRDIAAWYHIVLSVDTTQATAANRVRLFVNGNQVTSFSTATYPSQNLDMSINNNINHWLANNSDGAGSLINFFDGYMDEINFIGGQALTPSSFGSFNATTGVWQPARYTGTYGTNGFYLNFTEIALTSGSNAGLGRDFSGNGNFWNTNNISVTAGSTYDAMRDVPTLTSATVANYCVLNPLVASTTATITNANLNSTGSTTTFANARATFTLSSGKWYWEQTITGSSTLDIGIGLCTEASQKSSATNIRQTGWYNVINGAPGDVGSSANGGANISISTTNWATNDIIMVAYDADTGYIWFGRNGTWYPPTTSGSAGNPAAGTNQTISAVSNLIPASWHYNTNAGTAVNFGQRPFAYTPPTGFVALNTFNLPTSTIVKGNTVMDATLYTGNGGTQTITNAGGFRPDFVWLKRRNISGNNGLYNSITGAGNFLVANATDAENSGGGVSSFNSNGWSFGNLFFNDNGDTFVGWQWQAGQGTNTTNTAGTITTTTSVNTTAGFSIVTFTGTGASASIGHGLGVAPKFMILKRRNSTSNWTVLTNAAGSNQFGFLDLTVTFGSAGETWNSTIVNIGANFVNGGTYVMYAWAEIAGFSRFGSYTGNGSTDGPFVFTGFRPKFIMVKRSSTTGDWFILDTSRDSFNAEFRFLYPNLSNAEETSSVGLDGVSNGFKIRNTFANINASGSTYIYMAFAENPFKNALAR